MVLGNFAPEICPCKMNLVKVSINGNSSLDVSQSICQALVFEDASVRCYREYWMFHLILKYFPPCKFQNGAFHADGKGLVADTYRYTGRYSISMLTRNMRCRWVTSAGETLWRPCELQLKLFSVPELWRHHARKGRASRCVTPNAK